MQKSVKVAIIVGVIVIGIGLASPLFYEREIDEPLPVALNNIEEGLTLEKFSNMDEVQRLPLIEKMPEKVRDMIMDESSKITKTVSQEMPEKIDASESVSILKKGEFQGLVGHHAEGTAKIILVNEQQYLRFENFQVTNGPDLRVYVTDGGDIKKGIHLEKLKGSKGDQNYLLENIDIEIYDTIVIYCQPFGVYFGKADLL